MSCGGKDLCLLWCILVKYGGKVLSKQKRQFYFISNILQTVSFGYTSADGRFTLKYLNFCKALKFYLLRIKKLATKWPNLVTNLRAMHPTAVVDHRQKAQLCVLDARSDLHVKEPRLFSIQMAGNISIELTLSMVSYKLCKFTHMI